MARHPMTVFDLAGHGFLSLTDWFSHRAPGVKVAATRWLDWAGYITGQNNPLFAHPGVRVGNRREQSLGIRVGRVLENGVPLGKLNNPAQVHDRNFV